MSVFEYDNYKKFVRDSVKKLPRKGYGQLNRIAKHLAIHTTMVSHIFNGEINLTMDQALALGEFLGLRELETEYFINLVQIERAATKPTREFFRRKNLVLAERHQKIANRVAYDLKPDPETQTRYYSLWYYCAIRIFLSTRRVRGPGEIAKALGLPKKTVADVLDFLIGAGFAKIENGVIISSSISTFAGPETEAYFKHAQNWRLRGLETANSIQEDEVLFTTVIAISKADFARVREETLRFIEKFRQIGDPSPSEEVCYLNIDWRKLTRETNEEAE